jgi:hypothetical protein
MNVLITLIAAGTDTGPFNLYSNVDSFTTAFQTNVSKSSLINGVMITTVPNTAAIIRVKSISVNCTNSIDLPISGVPQISTTTTTSTQYVGPSTTTTTSSTSTSTSTTSTSTSSTSTSSTSTTTSTTTTSIPINHPYSFQVTNGYTDAAGACASGITFIILWGDNADFLSNIRYYAAPNSNTYFNGGGLYYNYVTNGQYVQISNIGINLGGSTCA